MRINWKDVTQICNALRCQMEEESGTDLGGYCTEASVRLFWILRKRGLDPIACAGRVILSPNAFGDHWWVELKGRILDLTGDQFNNDLPARSHLPKVLIRPISRCRRHQKTDDATDWLLKNSEWQGGRK